MCSNYEPLLDNKALELHFGVSGLDEDIKKHLWPYYMGPFIRLHENAGVGDDAVQERELLVGSFGMIPYWVKDPKEAKFTFNARSETVREKRTFSKSWREDRRCIIPAVSIYEPDWRSGKAINTRISRKDDKPMGIAGLWSTWSVTGRDPIHSFTMLTLNADDHSFMREFHKPGDEKRMLVILQEENYGDWLNADQDVATNLIKQFPPELLISG